MYDGEPSASVKAIVNFAAQFVYQRDNLTSRDPTIAVYDAPDGREGDEETFQLDGGFDNTILRFFPW